MNGLMAHCDTSYTAEETVLAVPEPEWTDTWHPISHAKCIGALDVACRNAGIETRERVYSLSKDGGRMFGAWTLDFGNSEMAAAIGLRNSVNKSMLFGITSGSSVFVCDNLAFSGDFVEFKKHTKTLTDDLLLQMANRALFRVVDQAEDFMAWHMDLKNVILDEKDFQGLTFRAMRDRVITPSKFNGFCLDLEAERDLNGNTLYSWHGAVTRNTKGQSLFQVDERNRRLNQLINEFGEERRISQLIHRRFEIPKQPEAITLADGAELHTNL